MVNPEASVRVPPYLGFSEVGATVVGACDAVDGATDVVGGALVVVGVLEVPQEARRLATETMANNNSTAFLFTSSSQTIVSRATWR
jgi:hypothetical protein